MIVKKIIRAFGGLPFSIGTSYMSCGAHVTRYTMYNTLATVLGQQDEGRGSRVLSISHSQRLVEILGLGEATVENADYPEHNATDLKAFGDEQFDFVVSDQVLEHVEGNPQRVFDESRRLLKKGGIAVHTTCFINPVHGYPSDYWRFTPKGLAYLAGGFSEILEVGGFGNKAVWIVSGVGHRMTPVPHAKWHPLHIVATRNDPNWPVSTWVVARK